MCNTDTHIIHGSDDDVVGSRVEMSAGIRVGGVQFKRQPGGLWSSQALDVVVCRVYWHTDSMAAGTGRMQLITGVLLRTLWRTRVLIFQ